MAPFQLSGYLLAYPPAKHSANFVDLLLEYSVLLDVKYFSFFHETYEKTESIQLYTCFFKNRRFIATLCVSCFKEKFNKVDNKILASFVDSKSVCLGDNPTILVKCGIQLISLL